MTVAARQSLYSIEEYLRLEEYSNVRHEYLDGAIRAMAGGTPEHAALAMAVGASLGAQLRGRRCRVYGSDLRVRVVATGLDTYPDLAVVCGREERDREDRNAIVNPAVLVEVTSPSTEEYDRGDKLDQYKRIPALREVAIVSHRDPSVEVWRRGEDGGWQRHVARAGEVAELSSVGCRLDVDDLYRDPLVES